MWRTGISGGEGGRAVFSLTRGGATDLRSVPEPSLADSIFSLEEANVQDLGESMCLTVSVGVGGWGWGGTCLSYGLSASGARLRTRCSRPVRLAICFSMASIRSLHAQRGRNRILLRFPRNNLGTLLQ